MKEIKRLGIAEEFCIYGGKEFSDDYSKHFEGLLTQGNGYMDVRGSFGEGMSSVCQAEEYDRRPANVTLEKHKKQATKWGTYVPGVVGKHPNLATEIINLPFFFDASFNVNGCKLDMESAQISDYAFYLNMRDGSLTRELVLHTNSGKVKMEFFRFLSKADAHLALQEIKITPVDCQADVHFELGINAGVRTNGFNHFEDICCDATAEAINMKVATNGGSHVCMSAKLYRSDESISEYINDEDRIAYVGNSTIQCGQALLLQKLICVTSDTDVDGEGDYAERNLNMLRQAQDLNAMYADHCNAWDERWKQADIVIEGDDELQKALRMSMYHLMRSCNEDNPYVAICAKGYAGEAYFGRYFWDTEINMLPFYIYTNPKAAKSLIEFRYHSLEGAKRNAASYGYKGARYAWESSVAGDEECMNWQYCDHEVHVTADIIYAIMHYVKATGDEEFMKACGAEIMVETARYWVSRVDRDSEGRYVLLGVMGPDEYLAMTRNNAYTNYMVKYALKSTLDTLRDLKESDPLAYNALENKTSLTDEDINQFEDVCNNIKIAFDKDTDIILECDEFMDYADVNFDEVWLDRNRCFGEFISQERNYRTKALKQADVLEMMMLFPKDFSDKQLKSNYEFYEPITTHDSSLSAFVHGLLAGRLDRAQDVEAFTRKVIDTDFDDQKRGAEEGIHIANCGGIWQLVVLGFAGMQTALWEDQVKFEPKLPKHIKSIRVPIIWKGKRQVYTVTPEKVYADDFGDN